MERGFDAVTLDDIATAANVAKMTVFNYFPRKEDLVLDRQDDLKLLFFRDAIRTRPPGQSPVEALRALLQALREQRHPFVTFDRQAADFWRFVAANPSLEARLREHNEEAAEGLALELGGLEPDGLARLAAGIVVLTVGTARREATRVFERGGSSKRAHALFFRLIERGFAAVQEVTEAGAAGAERRRRARGARPSRARPRAR